MQKSKQRHLIICCVAIEGDNLQPNIWNTFQVKQVFWDFRFTTGDNLVWWQISRPASQMVSEALGEQI